MAVITSQVTRCVQRVPKSYTSEEMSDVYTFLASIVYKRSCFYHYCVLISWSRQIHLLLQHETETVSNVLRSPKGMM